MGSYRHTHIFLDVHTYLPTYLHTYIHAYICMNIYIYTHTHTHICIYTHAFIQTCIHMHIHTDMRTYVHVYMHACADATTQMQVCRHILHVVRQSQILTCSTRTSISPNNRACRLRRNTDVDRDSWHGHSCIDTQPHSCSQCDFLMLVSLRLFSFIHLVAEIPERTATRSQAPDPKDLGCMSGTRRGSVAAVTIAPPRSLTAQKEDDHSQKRFSMPYTLQCEGDGRLLQLDSPALLLPVS